MCPTTSGKRRRRTELSESRTLHYKVTTRAWADKPAPILEVLRVKVFPEVQLMDLDGSHGAVELREVVVLFGYSFSLCVSIGRETALVINRDIKHAQSCRIRDSK